MTIPNSWEPLRSTRPSRDWRHGGEATVIQWRWRATSSALRPGSGPPCDGGSSSAQRLGKDGSPSPASSSGPGAGRDRARTAPAGLRAARRSRGGRGRGRDRGGDRTRRRTDSRHRRGPMDLPAVSAVPYTLSIHLVADGFRLRDGGLAPASLRLLGEPVSHGQFPPRRSRSRRRSGREPSRSFMRWEARPWAWPSARSRWSGTPGS